MVDLKQFFDILKFIETSIFIQVVLLIIIAIVEMQLYRIKKNFQDYESAYRKQNQFWICIPINGKWQEVLLEKSDKSIHVYWDVKRKKPFYEWDIYLVALIYAKEDIKEFTADYICGIKKSFDNKEKFIRQ